MSAPRGLIVIDKPIGPTSHDVVGKLRRLFQTKRVGHAGTLDPMATGVLVALVGEATKLSTWLVLDDKAYVARVSFGRATDSLDATGKTTREEPTPEWLAREAAALGRGDHEDAPQLCRALEIERTRALQLPPSFSAIQMDGVRAHAAARAGRALDLAPRAVVVRAIVSQPAADLEVRLQAPVESAPGAASIDVVLDVGKGYYVRSFARDLGETLGVPSCLDALRRTRSGPFTLASATTLEALAAMSPLERAARLVPLADVVRSALPCVTLSDEGLRKASMGQRLAPEHFATAPPSEGPSAWMNASGELVSVGELRDGSFSVLRNFPTDACADATPHASPDADGADA